MVHRISDQTNPTLLAGKDKFGDQRPPGRPYGSGVDGLRNEARRILKEGKVPTPGSVSDRLRAKSKFHSDWAQSMEKRLDAIDEMEAKALPVIEREMQEREYAATAVHNDAEEIKRLAEDIKKNGGPTLKQSAQGSGNGAASTEAKPAS